MISDHGMHATKCYYIGLLDATHTVNDNARSHDVAFPAVACWLS